jgi:ATP-dependent DNA helicase RecG
MLVSELKGRPLNIPGIGPARLGQLAKLGIFDQRDLLLHLPRSRQDRRQPLPTGTRPPAEAVYLRAVVSGHQRQGMKKRKTSLLRILLDASGQTVILLCFNREFLAKSWPVGTRLHIWGVFEENFEGWVSSNFEALRDTDPMVSVEFGRVVPVYGLTEGLTQRHMRGMIFKLLQRPLDIQPILPEYLQQKRKLPPGIELLRAIHFPSGPAEAEGARNALAYSELLLFEMQILIRRARLAESRKPHSYTGGDIVPEIETAFGFRLTPGQLAAWQEIRASMLSPAPMQRLLMGDVGSGKTALAAAAVLLAARSGLQAALAAPTVILARQNFDRLSRALAPLGVRAVFVRGGQKGDERANALERIARGEADLIVGTHALFQEEIVFRSLGLVLIDEQQRFGVRQRSLLREKGVFADYLAMSATPIPRTLALSIYGDFDASRIQGLPAGRQPIATRIARGQADIDAAYRELAERIARDEQGYVVYPAIGLSRSEAADRAEDPALATEAAHLERTLMDAYAELSRSPLFAGQKRPIALLHGKLDDEEKMRVMRAFEAGEYALLVSTSVIEVGIDNPNANIMIIHGAERFGLSQLHQLRGRVGRGQTPASCYLIAGNEGGEESFSRLQILADSQDGYHIAEADLAQRGPGDFVGLAQAGLPRFYAADISQDMRLLNLARQDAEFILKRDPRLLSGHNAQLAELDQVTLRESGYE